MKFAKDACALILLCFATSTKLVQSRYVNNYVYLDFFDQQTFTVPAAAISDSNGPVIMVWQTSGYAGDDEYRVKLKQNGASLYDTGEIDELDRIASTGRVGDGGPGRADFQVQIICENETADCEGSFRFAIVGCGCGFAVKTADCEAALFDTAKDAVCDESLSSEDIIGSWYFTEISGPRVSQSITYGTTVTTGSSVTSTQTASISVAVQSGFDFKGVKGTVTVTGTLSTSIANTVSESFAVTQSETTTVGCPVDLSLTSTGIWFLWQWRFDQEEDSVGRPGFSTLSKNVVCTESANRGPLCPLNFCANTICDTCTSDFEDLSDPVVVPTPAPTPAPTNSPFLCFSDRTMVEVEGKGTTRMDQLKIGDSVLTSQGHYSKVYSFGHFAPKIKTEFLQIRSMGMDAPLEITKNHMLYVNSKMMPAGAVKPGDYLSMQVGPTQVISVGTVTRLGAYAPVTVTGDIVVNGVTASNFIAHDAFKPFLSHDLQHTLQNIGCMPYHLYCSLVGCENETYNEAGLSKYAGFGLSLLSWLEYGQYWAVFVHLIAATLGYYIWKMSSKKEMLLKKRPHKIN